MDSLNNMNNNNARRKVSTILKILRACAFPNMHFSQLIMKSTIVAFASNYREKIRLT